MFSVILCYAIANSVFRCARVISVFRYVIHRNCKNHFRLVLHLMLTVHVIHKPVGFQHYAISNVPKWNFWLLRFSTTVTYKLLITFMQHT